MRVVAEAVPTWQVLQSRVPADTLWCEQRAPQDTVLDPSWPEVPEGRVVLFRDRNGWCPYCERVWLALLEKGVQFDEVLIELQGRKPGWYYDITNGSTPAVRWADGTYQGESADILYAIDERYPDGPALLPADPAMRAAAKELIGSFRAVMPSGLRPSARTAFLFQGAGQAAGRPVFESTLDGVEELPLLHRGLAVRGDPRRPRLTAWFDAMETRVPAYSARVQGAPASWAAVLSTAGYGNSYAPREPQQAVAVDSPTDDATVAQRVWAEWAADRDGIGRTPAEEAAVRMLRNHAALCKDTARFVPEVDPAAVDTALRVCVHALLTAGESDAEADAVVQAAVAQLGDEKLRAVSAVAGFNASRVCVPRDMGRLPAAAFVGTLNELAAAAQTRLG